VGYVPEGMSPEQYRKLKQKEDDDKKNKKFGAYGPQTFKSRSMQSFQKDLEDGKASHLMPVFNAQEKLKKGIIKKDDIPYMQRLGAWDDSDLGKKKQWRSEDKEYNANQKGFSLDWTGKNPRSAPQRPQKQTQENNKKKLFGLF
jgi:hypothetical protein